MKLEDALVLLLREVRMTPVIVPGKNLFHSFMPSEVEAGTLILTRVPIMIDPYHGLRKGTFQVICRNKNLVAAHDAATTILNGIVNEGVTKGGVNFRFIKALNEPLVFPRTEGGQFEASVNYNFAASWSK